MYKNRMIRGEDPEVTKLYGDRTAKTSCAYLTPYITKSDKILDVGCGPGIITSDLSKIVSEGHVTGVDNAEGIIQQARSSFPTSDYPNLTYAVADATKLSDFEDNSFDVVHCHALLVHLPDPVTVLKEFYRVCKPGGIIACRESSPSIILSLQPDLPPIRQFWERAAILMDKMGAHSDAGIKLESWAREAGIGADGGKIVATKSPIWNASQLSRTVGQPAEQAIEFGMASKEEMDSWADAWRQWEAAEGSELIFEAGEILCWKGK